eukprot:210284-Amphidinium_carterae.1
MHWEANDWDGKKYRNRTVVIGVKSGRIWEDPKMGHRKRGPIYPERCNFQVLDPFAIVQSEQK